MTKPALRIQYPLLVLVTIVVCGCAFFGFQRLKIDTDVIRSLPAHEQEITDALEIFRSHPLYDQVAVDIGLNRPDPDALVACSRFVQTRMQASHLFTEIGIEDIGALLPQLTQDVVRTLPLLFTAEELEHQVAPRLIAPFIHQRLQGFLQAMGGLTGIGQAAFFSADPLGLKDLALARLSQLAPSDHSSLYKGNLLSQDGRHLLLVARPRVAGTDTAFARQLAAFFTATARELQTAPISNGYQCTLTPVGAFRAALDNEEIIRHDVRWALLFSTVGIALLLLIAFPRPWLGLLSLVPALAGTAMALFTYSLIHSSISIMVLGFGGALIAITVDHGIAYLLFLDRPQATESKQAAHVVRRVGGGMALITTMIAFLLLSLSDFPVFTELGQFTALGFLFTFLFIHLVFPRILPGLPAASDRRLPLRGLLGAINSTGKIGLAVALLIVLLLVGFARPVFKVNLSDMNTVSKQTRDADLLFAQTWGAIDNKIYLISTAATPTDLQQVNDRLLTHLEQAISAGQLQHAFAPSRLFPGPQRSRENCQAWNHFWSTEKRSQVEAALQREGADLGLTSDAFTPFADLLAHPCTNAGAALPLQYYKLLGITENDRHQLVQFLPLTPGPAYESSAFHKIFQQENKIFDARAFSQKLGHLLFNTFAVMFVLLALAVALLLFFQFLSWRLTGLTLLPPLFAFICTLGSLHLIGHPLDIPGLMLSIIILGMGVDYSIYMVRGCQWYGSVDHPDHILVRSTVFLAGSSTLIGFGVLCGAEHSLLRSVGIVSLLGIFYSLAGTFLLLPPLLRHVFRYKEHIRDASLPIETRIRFRYRLLEAYPRMFVRYKLKLDPLFKELDPILAEHQPTIILDIGCGYGIPACWCLERWPWVRIIGVDPDSERIRVAARAVGERGEVLVGAAPHLPVLPEPVEAALLLDMAHYLNDNQLEKTLQAIMVRLTQQGIIALRFVTRPEGQKSIYWYMEECRIRLTGQRAWYRTPEAMIRLLQKCGFVIVNQKPSANSELYWLVGRKQTTP
ncbi:MAG: methyltransferase domain-containing protein [Desulfobulbus sp.]